MPAWFQSAQIAIIALSLVSAPVARAIAAPEPELQPVFVMSPEALRTVIDREVRRRPRLGRGTLILAAVVGAVGMFGSYQAGRKAGVEQTIAAYEEGERNYMAAKVVTDYLDARAEAKTLGEDFGRLGEDQVMALRLAIAIKQSELLARVMVNAMERGTGERSIENLLRGSLLPGPIIEELLQEGIFDGQSYWKFDHFELMPGGKQGSFDLQPPKELMEQIHPQGGDRPRRAAPDLKI